MLMTEMNNTTIMIHKNQTDTGSYTIDYPAVITLDDINNQAKGFQEIIETKLLTG